MSEITREKETSLIDLELGVEEEIEREARKLFKDRIYQLLIFLDYFPRPVQVFLLLFWIPVFAFEIHRLATDGKQFTQNKPLLLSVFFVAILSFYSCLAKTGYGFGLIHLREKYKEKKRELQRKYQNGNKTKQ